MVSNARVMEEQAKLATNDAYVAAHGPSNPVRQGVTPESIFSHPGLIREALENPGDTIETINEGSLLISAPLTDEGGTANLSSEDNTAEMTSKPPKGVELTDAQKESAKDVKTVDVSQVNPDADKEAKAAADREKAATTHIDNTTVDVRPKA